MHTRLTVPMAKLPTIIFSAICLLIYTSLTMASTNRVAEIDIFAKLVATQISKSLINQTKKITNFHKIKEDFEKLESKIIKKKLRGREVIKKFKEDIETIFQEKTEALKNIKKKAEEAKKKHVENMNLKRFDYFNMRNINKSDNISLRIHPPFSPRVSVNMSHSFVQVPTNIYAYKPEILNTVTWTDYLDGTFKNNYFNQSEETLLYQYYGDQSGLMRIYPGNTIGSLENKVDLFDCRRRVWYIQASASPKDVVIVIDISGSMTGSNIGIARIATASLIETLSEDDYFNVITVNDKVKYIRPCARHLVQATKLNKEALKLALDDLETPKDIANPHLGIEEAFKILNSGRKHNRTTASCNQAIMFISDGVEGEYVAKEVFHKYNKNKTVRAFAFLVGRIHVNVGRQAMVKMACDNRGHFYPIETVGNVWDKVLDYLQVMSRPMNSTRNNELATYTPMYLDGGGLGMIMSISMGVFDDTGLIGVTGTDITLTSLLEKLPVSIFGPFSHIFIINNNGFVIMHPKLKEQKGYLVAPRNIFLEDLLLAVSKNKSMQLKRNMVNQVKGGSMDFPMYWLYERDRKVTHINTKIYYEPIDKTEFSAGVVIADDEVSVLEYDDKAANEWLEHGIEALRLGNNTGKMEYKHVQIARWEYCDKPYDKTTSKSVKNYYTAPELRAHLKKYDKIGDLPANCNANLVKRLLITSGIANKRVSETWKRKLLKDSMYDGVFISTNAGYVKYYSRNQENARFQRNFVKPLHFEMAAANARATISVAAPYVELDNVAAPLYFTVSAAVKVGLEEVMTAVSGVRIRSDFFRRILDDATLKAPNTYCASNDTNICALIDQNGYIISSNQGEQYTGRFIGEISSILIGKLAEVGIFKKIRVEDTQAECQKQRTVKSHSNSLLTPFKVMFQGVSILLQTLTWIAIQYSTLLLTPVESKKSKKREEEIPIKVSCTMHMQFYVFEKDKLTELGHDKHKEANCDKACNMIYYLNPVPESNLLFLLTRTTRRCRGVCRGPNEKLTHVKETLKDHVCNMTQRYRRQPRTCYNHPIGDENLMCGRAAVATPSSLFFFAILMTGVLARRVL